MPIFRRENGQLAAVPGNYAILDQTGKLNPVMFDITKSLYFITDRLIHSNDAEIGPASSFEYTLAKTISITTLNPLESILRIGFTLRNAPVEGGASYAQIYKNGVAVGTERVVVAIGETGGDSKTFVEDLQFTNGDTIELWYHWFGPTDTYVSNLRIYGDKNIVFNDPSDIFPEGFIAVNV